MYQVNTYLLICLVILFAFKKPLKGAVNDYYNEDKSFSKSFYASCLVFGIIVFWPVFIGRLVYEAVAKSTNN